VPKTKVVFFKEKDGTVPITDWLDELIPKAQIKCLTKLGRLEQFGHELRRPEADLLRDGIHELRVGLQGVNYRILYFFYGTAAVVVSHGLTKEKAVPPKEIDRAVERKRKFERAPKRHTFEPGK
jgi:phage-related protein